MDAQSVEMLRQIVNFSDMTDPRNVTALGHLSRKEREEFALATNSLVLYIGDEVKECQDAEESATLKAAPNGLRLDLLNGLNIGCGNRLISPYLVPVDIMRQIPNLALGGEHGELSPSAMLAVPDELPFRENSIDYIVSLHSLEHMANPSAIILHWLSVLKPGGGIGVVVPDWRYTWDARADSARYGHKWNASPEYIKRMYDENWAPYCALEAIMTYDFKISFDFVLRKHGEFRAFSRAKLERAPPGSGLFASGSFEGA